MVKLPTEKFVSGDGWAATYIFNGTNYTTGYSIASQIRKKPTLKATETSPPLATPTIAAVLVVADTRVTLSLTATQTRALGKGGWLDIQITQTGGQPYTIVQQELVAQGDTTK